MKTRRVFMCLLIVALFFGAVAGAQENEAGALRTEFDTMVVTATKTEHTLADVPEATTVITAEEIEAQNATNILEVLRWIPGLTISDAYGSMGGDRYLVDGAPSDYTLMLVDGNRTKGSYILSEIPISSIERIEVVKGANSLLYGSDAMTGVINIITKGAPEKFTASAKITYSSGDEEDSNTQEASLGFKLGKLRQLYTYGRKEVEDGQYESDSFAGKFGIDLNESAELKFDVKVNQYEKENNDMDRYGYLLQLDWDVDERSSLMVKGFFRDYESVSHVGGAVTGTEEESAYDEEELVYTRLLGTNHLVTAGYQRMGDGFDYAGPDDKWSADHDSNSFFLQDEITLTQSFVIVPAIRVDYHSEWDEEINPKLSVLWKTTDTLNLRASWGTAFKAPSLTQMYRTSFHGHGGWGFWIMGNPDLQPEQSETFRFSAEKRFGNDFLGSIALFRSDFEDMIDGGYTGVVMPDGFKEYSYSNVAEAMTQGVEVNMKYYCTDRLLLTLGYTYLDTEDEETGEPLADTAAHRLTPGIRYTDNNIGFSVEVRGEYEQYDDADEEDEDDDNFMLHASISKRIADYAKLWINGNNLLDESQSSGISCEGMTLTFGLEFTY